MPLASAAAKLLAREAPKIIEKVAPNFSKAMVSMWDHGAVPMVRRVAASDNPIAQQIAQDVWKARSLGERLVGTALSATGKTVEELTPAESTLLAQHILGRGAQAPTTPRIALLLARGQQIAQATGRDFGHVVQQGAKDMAPALAQNGKALYQKAMADEAEAFTSKVVREQIAPMVEQLPVNSAERDAANLLVQGILRGTGGNGMLQGLRSLNTATLLGRAVMLNATQPGLSMAVAGLKPSWQALKQVATPQGYAAASDLALKVGTSLDSAMTDFLRHDVGTGRLGRLSTEVLRRTGFQMVERFNRRFATAVGNNWYDDLVRAAAAGDQRAAIHLARHGVKASEIGTPGAREHFIHRFVTRTQFRLTPEELPSMLTAPGWGGELAKTVFQFKPFSLKATELMIDEMKNQPLGFLSRAALGGAVLGVPANELRRITSGREAQPKRFGAPQHLVEGMLALGIGGMFMDAVQAAESGNARFMEFMTGPSGGLTAEVAANVAKAAAGKPKPLARTVVRRIPVVGPYVASKLRKPKGGGVLPQ